MLLDISGAPVVMILNNNGHPRILTGMKHILSLLFLTAAIGLLPAAAHAACYADYKARQDNPLRLHYGVMEVTSCDSGAARGEVAKRLAQNGWTLLNLMGVFDATGLKDRKANAGQFYLRF